MLMLTRFDRLTAAGMLGGLLATLVGAMAVIISTGATGESSAFTLVAWWGFGSAVMLTIVFTLLFGVSTIVDILRD